MVLIVFLQMVSLFILILVGFFIGRKKLMDSHTMSQLSKVINLIFNPMLIISSALGAGTEDRQTWFIVFGIAIGSFIVLILLSFLIAPFFDRKKGQKEMYQMMTVFSNLGFMGIPVVKGAFGAEYTVYVLAFMMAYNLFFYTFGYVLLDGKFTWKSVKGILNPGFISGILAIIIFLTGFKLPSFLETSVDYLGNLASPLAMLAVGITVASSDLKKIFTNIKVILFTLVRMIIIPLIFLLVLKQLPLDSMILGVCIVEIAMPVGNLCLIIGTEKGIDCSTTSAGIIMTTLLSVVTLPLICLLL